jgi:TonB family protein
VGPDGHVLAAEVAVSSGSTLLDEAALKAAETSRFQPSTVNGSPTQMDYLIEYTFSPED